MALPLATLSVLGRLAPIGIATSDLASATAILELAALAGLAGLSLGIVAIGEHRAYLAHAASARDAGSIELAFLATTALAPQIALALATSPWAARTGAFGGLAVPPSAWWGVMLFDLHAIALAWIAVRGPIGPVPREGSVRVFAFLLASWVVPSVALGGSRKLPLASGLLDPFVRLDRAAALDILDTIDALRLAAPSVGLLLLAGACRPAPVRHALRHPR